jgi:hypothetical protein
MLIKLVKCRKTCPLNRLHVEGYCLGAPVICVGNDFKFEHVLLLVKFSFKIDCDFQCFRVHQQKAYYKKYLVLLLELQTTIIKYL